MFDLLKQLVATILDFVFPPYCVSCRRLGSYLCDRCYGLIEFYPLLFVPPLEPLYLDQVAVCGHYESPLKDLITTYKYHGVRDLQQFLVELLWYSTAFPPANLITYIPLHPQKMKKRGFNQTQLLAEGLAIKLDLPCRPTLVKTRYHLAQAETNSHEARQQNVAATFALDPEFLSWLKTQSSPPQSFIIVDDVITTGATLNEAAKILKQAGIKKIYGVVLAHD